MTRNNRKCYWPHNQWVTGSYVSCQDCRCLRDVGFGFWFWLLYQCENVSFKTQCKGDKPYIYNSMGHFCEHAIECTSCRRYTSPHVNCSNPLTVSWTTEVGTFNVSKWSFVGQCINLQSLVRSYLLAICVVYELRVSTTTYDDKISWQIGLMQNIK